MYPATHRPLCPATSCLRYVALPITSLLALRLASTVAPATACRELGGIGIHRSSQISTPSTNPVYSGEVHSKRRSVPNGAVCPASRIDVLTAFTAGAK